mgnify:CR=1 FL=1
MATEKRPEHYVDNKEFLEHMIAYRESVIAADENGDPIPRIPDEIGTIFWKIASHLSYKSNFIAYAFRDDMISDGIENCVQYIKNFDPEKSKNPFSYFTQIIYYAFLRRIQKEKKQLYVRYKSLQNDQILDSVSDDDFIGAYEDSMEKKKKIKIQQKKPKKPKAEKGLKFVEDVTEEEKI